MDAWSEVGPASNLNLKGKRGEKMKFSPIFGNSGSGLSWREKREKLLLLSMIYKDRVVEIRRAKI